MASVLPGNWGVDLGLALELNTKPSPAASAKLKRPVLKRP